jgi:dienelactone hydrolase
VRRSPRVIVAIAVAAIAPAAAVGEEPLPGTRPLEWDGDLSARMVEGIDRFLLGAIERSVSGRERYWSRDRSSPEAYATSVTPNRGRFRKALGLSGRRMDVKDLMMTELEPVATLAAPAQVADNAEWTTLAVRWRTHDGVHGEGLLLRPKREPVAGIVAVPDADQTPEEAAGLVQSSKPAFASPLAEAGCLVIVPCLIDRQDTWSESALLGKGTNQPHREWIYRQAFQMGRHVIGYEVEKVQAAAFWLEREVGEGKKVGVAGWGEGGLIAFYAAATEPHIDASLVSGYFEARERVWEEPIYRNVFGLLDEFGDAEIASLIAPRPLIVEHAQAPIVSGPPPPRDGRQGAAPGRITTPRIESVRAEVARAASLSPPGAAIRLVVGPGGEAVGPMSNEALSGLVEALGAGPLPRAVRPRNEVPREDRMRRQVEELVEHVQGLLRLSEHARRGFWARARPGAADAWPGETKSLREYLWEKVIGRLPPPSLAADPRARKLRETDRWTAYEVVLDVWPDVFAWGYLLVPKGIAAGERRPAVVCQHGLEGVPDDVVNDDPESQGFRYYKAFAARLAERGFVTYAPHNPYRGGDRFRVLQRKANPLGKSLFSVIIGQHQRTLEWLGSLPFVDPARIGFYGLSYGGKTAMRVPAVLDGYALSICSADYNDWIRKNVTTDDVYSYLFTGEYEMFEFDLGNTFNYSDLAALIAPRPFMVERGHWDGVAPDEWVAYEYAKVRRLYVQLGIPDRTEVEFFDGPHSIHGVGTFEFLHRHLRWPKP